MVEKYNDNYHAYKYIAMSNNKIIAITQEENTNKGDGREEYFSSDINGNFNIYRIFKNLKDLKSIFEIRKKDKIIRSIIDDFQPDLIFCEELTNIKLAIYLKKIYNLPIVLRVEFAYNESEPYRTMGNQLKIFRNALTRDLLPKIIGKAIWYIACKKSSAVISCFYQDSLREISNIKSLKTYYVPWPAYVQEISDQNIRRKDRAIFIGSFDKHKNLHEFLETIPKIFDHTEIKQFIVVGDGEDYKIIDELKQKFPDKIIHIKSLKRNDCLDLIRTSYFSYSPAVRGGWGFIGDSWATKTPIVITHNHYGFKDGIDSIVTNTEDIFKRINQLYNEEIFNAISIGGYNKFADFHSAESVGQKYIDICNGVLSI